MRDARSSIALRDGARLRSRPSSAFWGPKFLLLIVVSLAAGVIAGFQISVAILTLAGVGAALAGVFRPSVGLLGIGILCVLDSVTRVLLMTGGLFRYNTFNYVLLLVIVVSLPRVVKISDTQTRLLLGLFLIMVLGLATSPDLAVGAFGMLNLAAEFGLLLYFLRASEDSEVLYWTALVNGVLAGLGCVVMFTQPNILRAVNPNAWAYMAVTALFSICLAYRSVTARPQRFALLVLTVVNCGWVFLSASRGSMLVALICATYLIHETRSASLRLSFGLFAILLAIAIATLFSNMRDYALGRVNKLFDERYSMQGRTSGRSELAATGIQMFLDNPLGRGTGAFATELGDVEGYHKQAHSGWIKTMVENGFLGVILLGGFIASFAFIGWRRRQNGALALGLLVTLSLGCALFSTEFNAKGLWFLAAGATSILSYPKRPQMMIRISRGQIQYGPAPNRAGGW